MTFLRALGVVAAIAALTGCAKDTRPKLVDPRAGSIDEAPRQWWGVLRGLAAVDRRVAVREGLRPTEEDALRLTMGSVLAEDTSVVVIDGSIDPFSFDARARGLARLREQTARFHEAADQDPRRTSDGVLIERLVGAEEARLAEERNLPRSASELVRALVDTWSAPKDVREAEERDRLLARRLDEVHASLERAAAGPSSVDGLRARELDDALDALEKRAETTGLTSSLAELVKLRDALEARGGGASRVATSTWAELEPRLRAQLGPIGSGEELERLLAEAESATRSGAERALDGAQIPRDAIAAEVEARLFTTGPCLDAIPGSPVRSMGASPEREAGCRLRHDVAAARDDRSRAVALAELHDHVVVAQWALDVARGTRTMEAAEAEHRLLAPPGPVLRARLERRAVVRPVATIGAGLVAAILLEGGRPPEERAARWATIGDVPLDIARRELSLAP